MSKIKTVLAILTVLISSFAVCLNSHGQGYVIFANTDSGSLNAPVTYAPGGVRIGSEFTAALLYSLDSGSTYTLLTQAAAGAGSAYPTPFLGTDGDNASGAGYFNGPIVTIPGYTSGAVNFIVQVYQGTSYATANITGQSAVFIAPSLSTSTAVVGNFPGGSLQPFALIPEPSIFALAGLGAAGLMAFSRRQLTSHSRTRL
jgi:hypothetical protein